MDGWEVGSRREIERRGAKKERVGEAEKEKKRGRNLEKDKRKRER